MERMDSSCVATGVRRHLEESEESITIVLLGSLFDGLSHRSRAAVCGRVPRTASGLETAASLPPSHTVGVGGGDFGGEVGDAGGGGVRGRPRPISDMDAWDGPDGSNCDGCELDGQWDTPLKAQSFLQHIVPWPCKAEQGMTTPVFCRPALNSFPTSHPFCPPGSRFLPVFPVSAPEKEGALQNHLD